LGCNNSAIITGENSDWKLGSLSIGGNGSGNTAVVMNCGLISVYYYLYINPEGLGSDNYLRLAYGFVALYGDQTAYVSSLIAAGKLQVWDATVNNGAGAWVTGTSSNVSVTYCADDASAKTATAKGSFAGYDSLGGFTIVFGGDMYSNVAWADVTGFSDGWYTSSWYGTFSADWCLNNDSNTPTYIWHTPDGWQYIDASSTSDSVYLWNYGTRSWRFTSKTMYPSVYDYSWGTLYTGYFPWIWDYTLNCWIYVFTDETKGKDDGYWLYYYNGNSGQSGYGFAYPNGGWWCYTNNAWTWLYYGSALPMVVD
jgi:hypothetical protein